MQSNLCKYFLRHQKHSTKVDGALITLTVTVLMWDLPDEAVEKYCGFFSCTGLPVHITITCTITCTWITTHGNTAKAALGSNSTKQVV